MNPSILLAWAMLAAVAVPLFALPFLPCWREWRHPTDLAALVIVREEENNVRHFADAFRAGGQTRTMQGTEPPLHARGDAVLPDGARLAGLLCEGDAICGAGAGIREWAHADGTLSLEPGVIAPPRATAGKALVLGNGVGFCRMHAPVIQFGARRQRAARPPADVRSLQDGLHPVAPGPDLAACGTGCYRAPGDLRLPPGRCLAGALIAGRGLQLDDGAAILGAVKAHSGVRLGRGVRIDGALVCEGDIDVGPDCWIRGPIVCAGDVRLGRGARIGTRAAPTTVSAARVLAEAGAIAHGTVWARDAGVVAAEVAP